MNEIVNLESARTEEYRKVLEQIVKDGKCPFCEENFRYHNEPILWTCGDWFITRNRYSYKEAEMAFLILNTKKHTEKYSELGPKDHLAIEMLISWAVKEFGILGGGIAMRFGEPKFTGATVRHLHAHLIVPKIGENGKSIPVNFPIG